MKKPTALILAALLLTGCAGSTVPENTAPGETWETTGPTETAPEETEPAPPEICWKDTDFVRILDFIPNAKQNLYYGTPDNFTGSRIYDFEDAYLRFGTVRKLALAGQVLEEMGYGLLIWDGFRPVAAQDRLWQICPDPNYVSSPTGRRNHCRGMAVDVSLYDLKTGKALPMPSGFDDFTAAGDRDYGDCTREQKENSMLLQRVMEEQGFSSIDSEWWHFSDTTDYPIEENFYPMASYLWTPECQEYINLRSQPGGEEVMARIPKGAAFPVEKWQGAYALVTYEGQQGYVSSGFIRPVKPVPLSIETGDALYPYEEMLVDLGKLSDYPEVSLESIGKSQEGRAIPVLRIGPETAPHHILIHGGIHGREHLTSWLVTAMADYWLHHQVESYGPVCLHILPMVNPDGVTISQTGVLSDIQREIYRRDQKAGYTELGEQAYAREWKANAMGVDPNRNFPSGWEKITDRLQPSSEKFRGEAPLCTPEMSALAEYTRRYPMDATISYHAYGSLIYWEYGDRQPVNRLSHQLGEAVEAVSGYPLEGAGSVDGAGYKDWAMEDLGIPSLTIEIGCEPPPLPEREMPGILIRNLQVIPTVIRWVQAREAA